MLTSEQRIDRYTAQTKRTTGYLYERLTPRQRRRIVHKEGQQWPGAVERREERSAARAKAREERKRRRSALLPAA